MSEEEKSTTHDVTVLLERIGEGDESAQAELLDKVYEQLHRIARRRMSGERKGHTLQATELVHEAYLRLSGALDAQNWEGRAHFYGAASEAMRRVLVEHARKKGAAKRGGGRQRVPLSVVDLASAEENPSAVLALDEAFARMEQMDPRLGKIVRLRFFAGLGVDDTAAALGISRRTVLREWEFARSWIYSQMTGDGD